MQDAAIFDVFHSILQREYETQASTTQASAQPQDQVSTCAPYLAHSPCLHEHLRQRSKYAQPPSTQQHEGMAACTVI